MEVPQTSDSGLQIYRKGSSSSESQTQSFTKSSDIVEIFNKHFSTIGQKLGQCFGRNVDVDRFPLKTETNFSLNPVSENFVRDQLRQLKPNKAIGLHKVSSR